METISNVVNTVSATATKAIWGEQQNNETAGNEPASGIQGKGTATEPYDGGNSEDLTASTAQNETAGKEPVSGLEGKGTAAEPFDLGNSADATNTATLPIREKPSTTEAADTPSLAMRPDETNTAGLAGTANLADTLAKTHLSDSKTDSSIDKDVVPASKNEPALAGFAENRTIDPEDKSQRPVELSNASTGDALTSTKTSDDTSAGVAGTQNLSDTLAQTNLPSTSSVTSPKGTPAVGNEGPDMLGTTKGTGEHTASGTEGINPTGVTESNRIMETKSEEHDKKDEGAASAEKEKVSKMDKLKEKLHIGHKH